MKIIQSQNVQLVEKKQNQNNEQKVAEVKDKPLGTLEPDTVNISKEKANIDPTYTIKRQIPQTVNSDGEKGGGLQAASYSDSEKGGGPQ
ncbi:MAG: hypothetical protein ACI9LM_003705 [Alteromonadaceae bacterium]|jgi:hypothetical protein